MSPVPAPFSFLVDIHVHLAALPDGKNGCYISPTMLKGFLFKSLLKKLNLLLPIDLLVKTPEQVKQRLELGDSFMREIVERGKVLYEAAHA